MRRYQLLCALAVVVLALSVNASAQRSRTVAQSQTAAPASNVAPAPASLKAKYEGGYTAYTHKQTGTLNFDDASSRLVFKDQTQHEYFSIPYASLAAIWSDTHAVTSTTARVIGAVPIFPVSMASLLVPKNKQRYLVLQFDDPDTKINGTTSFKLENKEMLASVLNTLAQKSSMKPRGDGFIRATQTTDKP
jgi:hypothetical protein